MVEQHNNPGAKLKIDILLKEYDTLRTEIVHRISHRFSFLTIAGGLTTVMFFKAADLAKLQIVALLVAALFLLILWFHIGRLIYRCSLRISEIEAEINKLAEARLLIWETKRQNSVFCRVHRYL